jgi:hypothetical protein
MKGTPWSAAAALCLIAAIVAGCATGHPTTLAGGLKSDKFGPCDFTYELEPGTTKVKAGSAKLSADSIARKCEMKEIGPIVSLSADFTKGAKVTDVLGSEVRIETKEESVRQEMPRGWCCRWYPTPNGGWMVICYPC